MVKLTKLNDITEASNQHNDLNSSKTVLEQVGEYMHEHDYHNNQSFKHQHKNFNDDDPCILDDVNVNITNKSILYQERKTAPFHLEFSPIDFYRDEFKEDVDQNQEQWNNYMELSPHQSTGDTVEVSPIISPMVAPNNASTDHTPFLNYNDLFMPYNQNTPHLNQKNDVTKQIPSFSPLSSPALTAIDPNQSYSSVISETPVLSLTNSTSRTKKASYSASSINSNTTTKRITKQSPQIGARKYSLTHNNKFKHQNWDDVFELPESLMSVSNHICQSLQTRPQTQFNICQQNNSANNISGEIISSSHSSLSVMSLPLREREDKQRAPSGSSMIINYPVVILPSTSINRATSCTDSLVIRATESPVIKPIHNNTLISQPINVITQGREVPKQVDINKLPITERVLPPEIKIKYKSEKDSFEGSTSKLCDDNLSKKEVHKVAEQSRRNRLNNALAELNSLIPHDLKKSIPVPSKATTVELACRYIRQITGQLNKK